MTEPPTRFDLRRSRILVAWLAAVHGGGVLAAWGSALPGVAAAALTVLATASFVRGLRLHALRIARDAVVWVALDPEPRFGFSDGRTFRARLRARVLLHPWLVTLRLDYDEGSTVVLVPRDSLPSKADHKAIRRRLRHGGQR